MTKTKFLILGGGPAGLTVANRLLQSGETSFLLLEKEAEAGGLCRSQMVDGAELDIGGGHFLDVRRPAVNKFLFQFMPQEEWNLFQRESQIYLDENNIVGHPLEANIWQMDLHKQAEYIKSIAVAGANTGAPMPTSFVDWILWKLGALIAEEYMLPYNQKMFGDDLDALGTYWLEKLPNVSFEETFQSCVEKKPFGTQPGHAEFYYPKQFGYGELWRRMGAAVQPYLRTETVITELDVTNKRVTLASGEVCEADVMICTIPWQSLRVIHGISPEMQQQIAKLKHSSIQVEYFPEQLDTTAHWVYHPDLQKPYHRILVRHNFCAGSKGYWTETRAERASESQGQYAYLNEYAYPLNTQDKPAMMQEILAFMQANGVHGVGRWGEHEHYNSDVTVARALDFCSDVLHLADVGDAT